MDYISSFLSILFYSINEKKISWQQKSPAAKAVGLPPGLT